MNKSSFDNRPDLVTEEGATILIAFDVEEVSETVQAPSGEDEQRDYFKAYAVRMAQPVTRSRVIDAIITAAYPTDVMQAIVNNHLEPEPDPDHEAEFQAMQDWRAHAKEVANEVMQRLE